ncbi:MAG: hypothetical protein JJU16_11545 [Alkalibacterium sp.]|nr:hypothetical protein [Alkalibacterium sp.]
MNTREKLAIKNMRFNRYILLRYSLALFFFANLNWFIFMLPSRGIALFVPAVLIFSALFSIHEFIVLYSSSKEVSLNKTKLFFTGQLIVNAMLILLSLSNRLFIVLFPFLNTNVYGLTGILGILITGAVISSFCLRKINAISKNKDRGYKLFANFKQSMKVSESYGK